jgi:hypothetical protein
MLTEKRNRKSTIYYEDCSGVIVSKVCSKCHEIKTLDSFAVLKIGLGGRVSDCKECRVRDYAKNRASEIERVSDWQRNNPDKVKMREQRRRALKKGLPYTITDEQYESTIEYFGGCALTGATTNLNCDHVIPLATGHGGTIHENMIPLRNDLNKSKSDANLFEWFERNKQRLNLEQRRFDLLIEWLASVNEMTTDKYRSFVNECFENKRNAGELGSHSA